MSVGQIADNYQKNNSKVRSGATATLFLLAALLLLITNIITPLIAPCSISAGEGAIAIDTDATRKAPAVVSANNIYIAWWTNNTDNGNEEVMFRASNDGGATFGPMLRLATNGTIDSTAGG